MNIKDSVQRIDQVVANAPMVRSDHDMLKSDIAFLMARAKLIDGKEQEINMLQTRLAASKKQQEEMIVLLKEILEIKWTGETGCDDSDFTISIDNKNLITGNVVKILTKLKPDKSGGEQK